MSDRQHDLRDPVPVDPVTQLRTAQAIDRDQVRRHIQATAVRFDSVEAETTKMKARVNDVERAHVATVREITRLDAAQKATSTVLARREGTPAAVAQHTAAQADARSREVESALRRQTAEQAQALHEGLHALARHVDGRLDELAQRLEEAQLANAKQNAVILDRIDARERRQSEVRMDREAREAEEIQERRRYEEMMAQAAQKAVQATNSVAPFLEELKEYRNREARTHARELWMLRILVALIAIVATLAGVGSQVLPIVVGGK